MSHIPSFQCSSSPVKNMAEWHHKVQAPKWPQTRIKTKPEPSDLHVVIGCISLVWLCVITWLWLRCNNKSITYRNIMSMLSTKPLFRCLMPTGAARLRASVFAVMQTDVRRVSYVLHTETTTTPWLHVTLPKLWLKFSSRITSDWCYIRLFNFTGGELFTSTRLLLPPLPCPRRTANRCSELGDKGDASFLFNEERTARPSV